MGRIHADLFAFLKRPYSGSTPDSIHLDRSFVQRSWRLVWQKICHAAAAAGFEKQDKDNSHQIINFALLLLETDLVTYACKIVSIVVGTVDVCICEAFRLKVLATTGCCLHTDEGTEAFIRLQVFHCPGKQRTLPR